MSKIILEKVAICNTDGELELAPKFLKELICAEKFNLEHLYSTPKGLQQVLDFAIFCRKNGYERDAIGILKNLMRFVCRAEHQGCICVAKAEHIKEKILQEVSHLWYSTDDCVWEEASQFQ